MSTEDLIWVGKIIKFKNNNIRYGQDFKQLKGTPKNINFTVDNVSDDSSVVILSGKGYGVNPYGNGRLCANKQDLTDYLQNEGEFMEFNDKVVFFKEELLTKNKAYSIQLNKTLSNTRSSHFSIEFNINRGEHKGVSLDIDMFKYSLYLSFYDTRH